MNSVVRAILIMYVRCDSPLGHNYKSLTSNFACKLPMGAENSQVRAMGVQLAPGVEPFALPCTNRGVGLGACSMTCAMKMTR